MALRAFGDPVSQSGFAVLAVLWVCSGLAAYLAVRASDVASHRRWMIRNFALIFAAVTLRICLPGSMALGLEFELVYPVIAWLCCVPNLVVAELGFNRRRVSTAG
jgi:hypothetical protein